MRLEYFAVIYAEHERDPASSHSYSTREPYLCKVLDNPRYRYTTTPEPAGVFIVKKMPDGRWHIKIDAVVTLDKPGLYTFTITAKDLRGLKWRPMSPWGTARIGKRGIMEYAVEKR